VRNWIYIGIIILLTAGVVVVWETPPELLLPGDAEVEHKAQLFSVITQAKARHFNDQGELGYTFTAEQLRHYRYDIAQVSEADYTIITQPRITFYTQDPPWHMAAATGRLTESGLILTLTDNVHIWRAAENSDERVSELVTETLTVRPVEKTARTEAPVTIDTATGTISAVGMTADLRKHHIQFLSEVEGSYDPEHDPD